MLETCLWTFAQALCKRTKMFNPDASCNDCWIVGPRGSCLQDGPQWRIITTPPQFLPARFSWSQVARALVDDKDLVSAPLAAPEVSSLNPSALSAQPTSVSPQQLLQLMRYREQALAQIVARQMAAAARAAGGDKKAAAAAASQVRIQSVGLSSVGLGYQQAAVRLSTGGRSGCPGRKQQDQQHTMKQKIK